MRQKDYLLIGGIIVIAAIISSLVAGAIFNSSKHHQEKVPVVQPINGNFPQAQSDPTYQAFFNAKALDPTQLIKIGTSQNTAPFNPTP